MSDFKSVIDEIRGVLAEERDAPDAPTSDTASPTKQLPEDTQWLPGARVQMHPATDFWARGDRYGVLVKHKGDRVHVRLEESGQKIKVHYSNIIAVEPASSSILEAADPKPGNERRFSKLVRTLAAKGAQQEHIKKSEARAAMETLAHQLWGGATLSESEQTSLLAKLEDLAAVVAEEEDLAEDAST